MKLLPRTPITADSNVGRGIEFALGIVVFLGLGYLVDHWLGTEPVFMIVLFFIGVIGQFAAMWYRYEASMAVHDEQRRADRHRLHAKHTSETKRSGAA